MIVLCREDVPVIGIVFIGADTLPFLPVSLSSLEDSSVLASDESSDKSAAFCTTETLDCNDRFMRGECT